MNDLDSFRVLGFCHRHFKLWWFVPYLGLCKRNVLKIGSRLEVISLHPGSIPCVTDK